MGDSTPSSHSSPPSSSCGHLPHGHPPWLFPAKVQLLGHKSSAAMRAKGCKGITVLLVKEKYYQTKCVSKFQHTPPKKAIAWAPVLDPRRDGNWNLTSFFWMGSVKIVATQIKLIQLSNGNAFFDTAQVPKCRSKAGWHLWGKRSEEDPWATTTLTPNQVWSCFQNEKYASQTSKLISFWLVFTQYGCSRAVI